MASGLDRRRVGVLVFMIVDMRDVLRRKSAEIGVAAYGGPMYNRKDWHGCDSLDGVQEVGGSNPLAPIAPASV